MLSKVIVVLVLILFTACHSLPAEGNNYTLLAEYQLPQELKETSGLFCSQDGRLFTLNDSGNKPVIYEIDSVGNISGKRQVDVKNKDWEALTGDSTHFYIGDIGNNNGKRKFVQIHSISKDTFVDEVQTSRIFYRNNVVEKNEYLDHDFDAETLVSVDNNLYLFSKSWKTERLFIYRLRKKLSKQKVEHIAEIENLPGVITGGDYDRKKQRFILVGYTLKGGGFFYPFITILDKQFNLVRSFQLENFNQVEGVCVTTNGKVLFTQEDSFFSSNKLVKIEIVE